MEEEALCNNTQTKSLLNSLQLLLDFLIDWLTTLSDKWIQDLLKKISGTMTHASSMCSCIFGAYQERAKCCQYCNRFKLTPWSKICLVFAWILSSWASPWGMGDGVWANTTFSIKMLLSVLRKQECIKWRTNDVREICWQIHLHHSKLTQFY